MRCQVRRQQDVNQGNMVGRWGRGRTLLKSIGKVRNIKGNALVADFAQICMFAYRILITGGDELSKCSLKYEPTVFNINTNVKVGITDGSTIRGCGCYGTLPAHHCHT